MEYPVDRDRHSRGVLLAKEGTAAFPFAFLNLIQKVCAVQSKYSGLLRMV
jgi:hypothetical protein